MNARGRMRLGYWFSSTLVRTVCRLLFGLRVRGVENVPRDGKILIVSNHLSNFDPPIIGSVVPREICFAAKIELFRGLVGAWVRYHNALPVRRSGSDKDAIKRFVGVLNEGSALLMFPEGTRARDPRGKDAKAGAGMVASLAKADVLPVHLTGTHDPRRALFRRGGMRVTFGERIPHEYLLAEARALAGDGAGKKELYQAISDVAMRYVRALAPERGR